MLLLFVVPIILTVTFAHRLLRAVAPSNILIARVRATRPTLLRAGGVAALALALAALAHRLTIEVAGGAAGWLNLVVLVLLWDAIKLMLVALLVAVHSGAAVFLRAGRRIAPCASVRDGAPRVGAGRVWGAVGTHNNGRRLTSEDVLAGICRFRYSPAGQRDPESDSVVAMPGGGQ